MGLAVVSLYNNPAPPPMRSYAYTRLRKFRRKMPAGFGAIQRENPPGENSATAHRVNPVEANASHQHARPEETTEDPEQTASKIGAKK